MTREQSHIAFLGVVACALITGSAVGQTSQTSSDRQVTCQALDQAIAIRSTFNFTMTEDSAAAAMRIRSVGVLRTLQQKNHLPVFERTEPLVDYLERSEDTVGRSTSFLRKVQSSFRATSSSARDLINLALDVERNEGAGHPIAVRLSAAAKLPTLLKNLSRDADLLSTKDSPDAIFNLGNGLNSISVLANALLKGDAELKIPAASNLQQRTRLQDLIMAFAAVREYAGQALGNLQAFVAADQTIKSTQKVSEDLIGELQRACSPT